MAAPAALSPAWHGLLALLSACRFSLHQVSPPPLPPCAGRRRLLVAGAALGGLSAMLASTAPSLWMYVAFRCASGVGVGGMGAAAYALAADLAGPSWRAFVGLLLNCFFSGGLGGQGTTFCACRVKAAACLCWKTLVWSHCAPLCPPLVPAGCQPCCPRCAAPPPPCAVGCCLATLLAMWVPSWRALTIIVGLASLAFTGAWGLVVESPQWLLLKGRKVGCAAVASAGGSSCNWYLPAWL